MESAHYLDKTCQALYRRLIFLRFLVLTPFQRNVSYGVSRLTISNWPDAHDFSKKRVGVIGNGSTSVQLIITLADQAKQLVSFQRHPQHVVPNGNGPVSADDRKHINEGYNEIWENVKTNISGHAIIESSIPAMSVTAKERERVLEQVWQTGNGIKFLFERSGILPRAPLRSAL
ncbi:hypothetical protein J3F84DRAFT_397671 [Trichoderma pleuroticola]